MLALNVLVAEQPSSKEWHIGLGLIHALILKGRIITMGSSSPVDLDTVYRIVTKF